jgi:hypothetical protein
MNVSTSKKIREPIVDKWKYMVEGLVYRITVSVIPDTNRIKKPGSKDAPN